MSKKCVSCGKEIPEAAATCVFCAAAQPQSAEPEASAEAPADAAPAVAAPAAETPAAAPSTSTPPAEPAIAAPADPPPSAPPAPSRGHVTLIGMRVEDLQAAMAAAEPAPAEAPRVEPTAPMTPMPLDPTPVRGLPVISTPEPETLVIEASPEAPPVEQGPMAPTPFSGAARLVMASGGLVLIALFSLPWHGVSSQRVLEHLVGAEFVRQLFFLAGGAVLVATAVLPVPPLFRAIVGTSVAAVPLVLGADGLLEGWRAVLCALVTIGLPAALLQLRPRRAARGPARALLLLAIAGIGIAYLAPSSSVMPIVYVMQLLRSGLVAQVAIGLFLVIPLVLGALSLMGLFARDLFDAAVLLALLVLLWPPAAVLYFRGDGTQLYVALALLWTAAIAALCAAQLLAMASRPQPR